MSWAPVVESSLEWLWRLVGVVIHVRVRAHAGAFTGPPQRAWLACDSITVTNRSTREIEITHAWFETPTGQVEAVDPERPLPVRLKPQQIWETWVPAAALATASLASVESLARVCLSDGRIVKGKKDEHIPHSGPVPGGLRTGT